MRPYQVNRKRITGNKKSKSLNNTMRRYKDRERILENQRLVDKLVNVQPVICANQLRRDYNKQRYLK